MVANSAVRGSHRGRRFGAPGDDLWTSDAVRAAMSQKPQVNLIEGGKYVLTNPMKIYGSLVSFRTDTQAESP